MSGKLKSAARFTAANAAREAASSVQNISGSNAGSDEGMSQGTSALGAGMSAFVTAAEENSRRKDQFNDDSARAAAKTGSYATAGERTDAAGIGAKKVGSQFSTETKNSRAAKAFSTRADDAASKGQAFKSRGNVLDDGGVSPADRGGAFSAVGEKAVLPMPSQPGKSAAAFKKGGKDSAAAPKKKSKLKAVAKSVAAQGLEDAGGELGETAHAGRQMVKTVKRTARGVETGVRGARAVGRGAKSAVNYSKRAAKRMSMTLARAAEAGRAMKGMSAAQRIQVITKAAGKAILAAARAAAHTLAALLAPAALPLTVVVIFMVIFSCVIGVGGEEQQKMQASAGSNMPVATVLKITSYFAEHGIDEMHAAAIIGNMKIESGINPAKVEYDPNNNGASRDHWSDNRLLTFPYVSNDGLGIGLCQWSRGRRVNLINYARRRAVGESKNPEGSWKNIDYQLDFFLYEDEWATWAYKDEFLATTAIAQATEIFARHWERPSESGLKLDQRVANANAALAVIQGGGDTSAVVNFALAQLGEPYVWAAEGPDKWDCSGLTKIAWAQLGVSLPHQSTAQANVVKNLGNYKEKVEELRPGDLVFYQKLGVIYHVAIYMGDHKVVHANGHDVTTSDVFLDSGFCGGGSPM